MNVRKPKLKRPSTKQTGWTLPKCQFIENKYIKGWGTILDERRLRSRKSNRKWAKGGDKNL